MRRITAHFDLRQTANMFEFFINSQSLFAAGYFVPAAIDIAFHHK
jgi:hypothetical protein